MCIVISLCCHKTFFFLLKYTLKGCTQFCMFYIITYQYTTSVNEFKNILGSKSKPQFTIMNTAIAHKQKNYSEIQEVREMYHIQHNTKHYEYISIKTYT